MKRDLFVQHLEDNACSPREEYTTDENELYFNCVNALSSIVPIDDLLGSITVIKICLDLNIAPPDELEADYHVFVNMHQALKENPPKNTGT